MLPNNMMSSKIKIKIQEIGTQYLGLVTVINCLSLSPSVTLVLPLDYEMWCTGKIWSKTNLPK